MDNLFTKEYIEKCINNPDLQGLNGLWIPKAGHYYIYKDTINILTSSELPHHVSELFWLPRQDELQIILKQKIDRFNNMTDLKFDFNMRQCIFKTYCTKILNLLSLNDMWLIFFMRELYGKQWVPESKSWQAR